MYVHTLSKNWKLVNDAQQSCSRRKGSLHFILIYLLHYAPVPEPSHCNAAGKMPCHVTYQTRMIRWIVERTSSYLTPHNRSKSISPRAIIRGLLHIQLFAMWRATVTDTKSKGKTPLNTITIITSRMELWKDDSVILLSLPSTLVIHLILFLYQHHHHHGWLTG